MTALMAAAGMDHFDAVKYLLEEKADPTITAQVCSPSFSSRSRFVSMMNVILTLISFISDDFTNSLAKMLLRMRPNAMQQNVFLYFWKWKQKLPSKILSRWSELSRRVFAFAGTHPYRTVEIHKCTTEIWPPDVFIIAFDEADGPSKANFIWWTHREENNDRKEPLHSKIDVAQIQ